MQIIQHGLRLDPGVPTKESGSRSPVPAIDSPLKTAVLERTRIGEALGFTPSEFLMKDYPGIQFFGGWVNRQAFTPREAGASPSATQHPDVLPAQAAKNYGDFLQGIQSKNGVDAREATEASIAMMSFCQVAFIFPCLTDEELIRLRGEGKKIVKALQTGTAPSEINVQISDEIRTRLARRHHDVWAGNREESHSRELKVAPHVTHRSWEELEKNDPKAIAQDTVGQVNGYACVLGLLSDEIFNEVLQIARQVRPLTENPEATPNSVAGYLKPKYANDPLLTKG